MSPGPDYTIFGITDLSMCTSSHDGGTSFLEAYASGSKLKVDDSVMNESETSDLVDPTYGFAEFIQSMDIILVGRGSYDLIMHHQSGQWPYPQKRLIVFTATPLTEPILQRPESSPQLHHYPPPANAEAFTGSPDQLVQKLSKEGVKSRKFKRESVWVMGGPSVRGRMLELGVVGRVELVMVPRIMKSTGGVPLWSFGDDGNGEGSRSVELELIGSRSYENGVVSLSYVVIGKA